MKKVLITIISLYHQFVSPLLHQLLGTTTGCRQNPTCSIYAQESISKYGVLKGSVLSLRRFSNCQPFFSI